jgi:phosphoglycerol transferase MdoB-like AlkP superfamily enzyme
MNSIRKQYIALTPFLITAYFTLKLVWEISIICFLVLAWLCVYSNFYKKARSDFRYFYHFCVIYCLFLCVFAASKFYGYFNTTYIYILLAIFIAYMILFFGKLKDL